MEGIQKLLLSLNYPFIKANIDLSDKTTVISLVTWLEDRKIRELEIVDRDNLRVDDSNWDSNFISYLATLNCPFQWPNDNIDCLFWLISYSISLDYDDNITNKMLTIEETTQSEASQVINIQKIEQLGNILNLNRDQNETISSFIKRIYQLVKFYLSDESIEQQKNKKESISDENIIDDLQLGFDTKDDIVNKISLVLRMLYLEDFRELQNDVNCLIVLGQEFTANPRLNASLGKVGR